jgi:hypothetical protein
MYGKQILLQAFCGVASNGEKSATKLLKVYNF